MPWGLPVLCVVKMSFPVKPGTLTKFEILEKEGYSKSLNTAGEIFGKTSGGYWIYGLRVDQVVRTARRKMYTEKIEEIQKAVMKYYKLFP